MDFFEIENLNSIRKITINNPRKRNALDREAYLALATLLNKAATDETVKCVVLTGKGDFYSSGNDLTQDFGNFSEDTGAADEPLKLLVEAFIKFPKLLICLVNGPCIGIAATTAALADIVYCSENAYFYTPFTALGLCAEGCSSYLFPSIMGSSKANELLMLNHKLSAREAYECQLVAHVYKNESEIWTKLTQIDKLPIGSIISNKKLIRRPMIEKLIKVNDDELKELQTRFESEEAIQAIINFQSAKKSKL
ncbi:enoyl-CoA delta isomerase 2-like [Chironomus tepperi]|uniref:enoyl-CoA delta isomerase 2-like n=1 Tax=Chironomus tepperi TaxID=113505 RepID=UPI00391EEB40